MLNQKNNSLSTYLGDDVIRIENVSVQYRVPTEQVGTLREYAIRVVQRKIKIRTFNALEDVSFQVKKGEVFGLIGSNGAGKSTLLKVVARVLRPYKGRVIVKGKVAPLLELGAGFHPELTGRENIYLNGSLLGYSRKQMDEVYSSIVDFSELSDFIDAPIRTYSSGMYARLGFSVAMAHIPEILIVDEILGVGDETFQKKCAQRFKQFQDSGTAILYVSHSLGSVLSMCHRVAWLDHGKVKAIGKPKEVVAEYQGSH